MLDLSGELEGALLARGVGGVTAEDVGAIAVEVDEDEEIDEAPDEAGDQCHPARVAAAAQPEHLGDHQTIRRLIFRALFSSLLSTSKERERKRWDFSHVARSRFFFFFFTTDFKAGLTDTTDSGPSLACPASQLAESSWASAA